MPTISADREGSSAGSRCSTTRLGPRKLTRRMVSAEPSGPPITSPSRLAPAAATIPRSRPQPSRARSRVARSGPERARSRATASVRTANRRASPPPARARPAGRSTPPRGARHGRPGPPPRCARVRRFLRAAARSQCEPPGEIRLEEAAGIDALEPLAKALPGREGGLGDTRGEPRVLGDVRLRAELDGEIVERGIRKPASGGRGRSRSRAAAPSRKGSGRARGRGSS